MTVLARGTITDRPWGMTLGALGARGLTGQVTVAAEGKAYRIAFAQGIIVGAQSPLASDAAVRLALTSNLVSSTQVSDITRRMAASPGREEVELLAELARLTPDQAGRLRRRLVAQRAARTFSPDQGDFIVEDAITIPVLPGGELDVRTVVYLGARTNASEDRLTTELAQLGGYFELKPEAIEDLPQFGFTAAEKPILDMLMVGAYTDEIEQSHPAIGPRVIRATLYALASCGACKLGAAPPRSPRAMTPSSSPTIPPSRTMTPLQSATRMTPPTQSRTMTPTAAPTPSRTSTPTAAPTPSRTSTPTAAPTPPRTSTPTGAPPRARTPSAPPGVRAPGGGTIPMPRTSTGNNVTVARTSTGNSVPTHVSPTPSPSGGVPRPTAATPSGGMPGGIGSEPSSGVPRSMNSAPSGGVPRPIVGSASSSGYTQVPDRPRTTTNAPAAPAQPETRKLAAPSARRHRRDSSAVTEIEQLLQAKVPLLDRGVDHFTLLGLSLDAPAADVRSAYFTLARKLHPDRLSAIGVNDEERRAQRLMAQVNLAFAVLNDPVKRDEYVSIMNRGGEAAIRAEEAQADELAMRVMRAEEAFKQGEMALRREQLVQAIEAFKMAVELQPREAEYQALLAWAQFAAAPDKNALAGATRKALTRAAEANERSPTAKYYLGRVERMLGREREALQYFNDVLAIKPSHTEAASEARILSQRLNKR